VARGQLAGGRRAAAGVLLVIGLVIVNAGGTFARLIESHLSVMTAASTSVGERIGVLDARIAEQARRVAGIEAQDREIADTVAKLTSAGKSQVGDRGNGGAAEASGGHRQGPSPIKSGSP